MILATALIFLIVITLLGLVAIQSSTTGLKLALNEQSQTEGLVTAQSMITTILQETSKWPSQPGDNYRVCYQFNNQPWAGTLSFQPVDCPVPNTQDGSRTFVTVQRLPPHISPPPPESETSLVRFGSGSFAVRGLYDRSEQGLGAADIEQGVQTIVPRSRRTY